MFRGTGVGGFISPQKRKPETLKTVESFSYMLHFALLRLVSKREGQIQSKFDESKFFNFDPHSE